ncbi:MAG TPA: dephospho-CoA kinase [Deltaproteobacteria bacterium]|nr:dephospho-CoA kinase [Deltaproteobacteria bacterium]HOM29093.1 dephospho-CoA kinase [Deltaproteobacteria bacterium]HPP81728.1 dephospho-CoA kinase [Deltaproteobacteria bacterium]
MFVAGLTGSIATGKSTVSSILEDLGAFIVDADRAAREVVLPGSRAFEEIVSLFGEKILGPDGAIDRARLARIVFRDEGMRRALEALVHPEVMKRMSEQVAGVASSRPDAVVILDVPLLFETGMHEGLDEVIVVYCPEDEQVRRLVLRDSLSVEEALARVRAQIPIEEKRRIATLVIDNSGPLESTRAQAERVYRMLESRALLRVP